MHSGVSFWTSFTASPTGDRFIIAGSNGTLINIDPEQRPRNVHDVMERLAALAGMPALEPLSVKRAYFTAPALIGRGAALVSVRSKLEALRAGRGSALLIHARPGEALAHGDLRPDRAGPDAQLDRARNHRAALVMPALQRIAARHGGTA